MVLTDAGFAARHTVTYRDAKRAFVEMDDLALLVIHADRPGERRASVILQATIRERPATAIVVVSSRRPEDLEPFPRTAVFLEKPFDRAQLMQAIEQAQAARPVA